MSFLNNALKAKELFKKDKDYVVVNGEVLIVDEFTGRMLHGRRYNEGMHQAIEAKEGVQIQNENQTFATITLQNYFRLYDKLAGMTGTAQTEANEFMQIYKLGVVPIPTNRPMVRADETDVIYQTQQAKFDSVVEDIMERHEAGQPVLVGTVSVEKSEILSVMLKRRGVPHHVLNAKYHEQEATIIAQSGRLGAVTVATNMAGRGTDIMLGGNPEFIADAELHQRGLSPVDTPEDYEAAWPEAVAKAKAAVAAEHEEVVQAGGLYVLGTERHESRRIDNQLRGRSGRQGDPGKSRFYLSLEDDLMRMFNSERVGAIMDRLNIPADVPVENSVVSRAIRSAQTQVESQNFEIRKDVLKYDDVLNRQRTVIYGERHEVLEGADLHEQVRSMIDEVTASYATAATADGYPEEWDLEKLWKAFKQLFPITLTIDEVIEEAGGEKGNLTADLLIEMVQENAQAAYDRREEEYTPELMRQIERLVVLSVLDQKWREHLYEMDYLREGIGLRAMAQRDPLVEYQREGFDMFNAMMDGIKEESVGNLFNRQFEIQENPIVEEVGAGAQLGFGGTLPGVTAGPAPAAPAAAPAAAAPAAAAPAAPAAARRRQPPPAPPSVPEPVAPPAAFGKRSAGSQPRSGQPAQPQGDQQPGGRARGRHAANDGRGHATAAGRGQAATRSGGTHAAVVGRGLRAGRNRLAGDRGRPGGRSPAWWRRPGSSRAVRASSSTRPRPMAAAWRRTVTPRSTPTPASAATTCARAAPAASSSAATAGPGGPSGAELPPAGARPPRCRCRASAATRPPAAPGRGGAGSFSRHPGRCSGGASVSRTASALIRGPTATMRVISMTSGVGCVVITRCTRARWPSPKSGSSRCRCTLPRWDSHGRICRTGRSPVRASASSTANCRGHACPPSAACVDPAAAGVVRLGEPGRLLIGKIGRRRAVDRRPHVGHRSGSASRTGRQASGLAR